MGDRATRLTLISLAATAAVTLSAPSLAGTRWVALVVGSNHGSSEQSVLRYAEQDARRLSQTLLDVGVVQRHDLITLESPNVARLQHAIATMQLRVEALRQPAEPVGLLFFYSGHSDEEALLLGRHRIAWVELRSLLESVGADVRVLLVDSCRSGSAIRAKGGKPAPGFALRVDRRDSLHGEVLVTSSATDEAAFESDRLRGSFFTHFVSSALRGAADANRDHKVTLVEAYRYIFDATVRATAMLPGGAQHPGYEYRLAGRDELVLSDLAAAPTTLSLPRASWVSVVDEDGQSVLELFDDPVREVSLAPGRYEVHAIRGGRTWVQPLLVPQGGRAVATWERAVAAAQAEGLKARREHGQRTTGSRPWLLRH